MEDYRTAIEDFMHRYGYEEEEAEVAYHLNEAAKRLDAIYQAEADEEAESGGFPQMRRAVFMQSNVYPHLRALRDLLGRRVLARHYPEGWGMRKRADATEEG